jgi:hypothetical protein
MTFLRIKPTKKNYAEKILFRIYKKYGSANLR